MQIVVNGTLLSAESRKYVKNGEDKVYNEVRFLVDDSIFACYSTPEQVSSFSGMIGKVGEITFDLQSRKEELRFRVSGFVPKK